MLGKDCQRAQSYESRHPRRVQGYADLWLAPKFKICAAVKACCQLGSGILGLAGFIYLTVLA